MIEEYIEAIKSGHKILICGNGGLAAESEHFAAEMMGHYAFPIYAPCIALTCNSSLLTAISNDIGFDDVFSHQIETLGNEGDILIAMTTSASKNIINACNTAMKKRMKVLLLNKEYVNGRGVAEIQENIIQFLHALAYGIKRGLHDNSKSEQQS